MPVTFITGPYLGQTPAPSSKAHSRSSLHTSSSPSRQQRPSSPPGQQQSPSHSHTHSTFRHQSSSPSHTHSSSRQTTPTPRPDPCTDYRHIRSVVLQKLSSNTRHPSPGLRVKLGHAHLLNLTDKELEAHRKEEEAFLQHTLKLVRPVAYGGRGRAGAVVSTRELVVLADDDEEEEEEKDGIVTQEYSGCWRGEEEQRNARSRVYQRPQYLFPAIPRAVEEDSDDDEDDDDDFEADEETATYWSIGTQGRRIVI